MTSIDARTPSRPHRAMEKVTVARMLTGLDEYIWRTVGDVAEIVGISPRTAYKHLRTLLGTGYLTRVEVAQEHGGMQYLYRLMPKGFVAVEPLYDRNSSMDFMALAEQFGWYTYPACVTLPTYRPTQGADHGISQ